MRSSSLLCFFALVFSVILHGQTAVPTGVAPIPTIVEKEGRHALLVDGKPFLILGGQAHNSSGWPAMLPKVWEAIGAMHANTLEVPIYWEQVEAERGKFDFSLIDTLLVQARMHHVRLVLLWFATWKNGSNHYIPGWMKKEADKYPNIRAKDGRPIDSPAPDAVATLAADSKAFAAVMKHLKMADPQRTVIMVQVENEPGAWDTVRDFGPGAQKAFEGKVPAQLLQPAVLTALQAPSAVAGRVVGSGTWQDVFGDRADEYFHAWSVARFIGQVAAAGKAEYALPMYVNAALRDPLTNPTATHYESGGATDNVIPIWKVAAPSIDLLAPDIYLSGSDKVLKVIDLYTRTDNPLFVPEAGLVQENAKYLYAVLGHGGIGFSPFGIDDNSLSPEKSGVLEKLAVYAQEYAFFAPFMREFAQYIFDGKVRAIVETDDHAEQKIDLGDWQAAITFGTGRGGKILIISLSADKFLLMGTGCRITFHPKGKMAGRAWQYLKVEEGMVEDGQFHFLRILNGDETDWGGPLFGETPTILRASLQVR